MNLYDEFKSKAKCNITELELATEHKQITVLKIFPKKQLKNIFICLHGYTSSKDEWLEIDGYTKGGNLVKELLDKGCGFFAFDAYKHGSNIVPEEKIDLEESIEDDDFYFAYLVETLNYAKAIYKYVKDSTEYKDIPLSTISYSMGNVVSTLFMNEYPMVKAAIQCVPTTCKDEDDEYAPINNMNNIKDVPFLFNFASKDEYVSYDEYIWFFDEANLSNKTQFSYESGHSLPVDYVRKVVEWVDRVL